MSLDRRAKERIVEDLNRRFKEVGSVFITDYRGLKMADLDELRRRLREASIDYMVVKNTLARLSVKDTELEVLSGFFEGPVALALSYKDSAIAAKILTGFSREQPNLEIKTGFLDGRVLSVEEVNNLAALPNREELLGQLVGLLKANLSSLVRVLQGNTLGLVVVLRAREDKLKAKT